MYSECSGRNFKNLHFLQQYQQELVQLREEFERYKTRAQTVLRSKENKVSVYFQ